MVLSARQIILQNITTRLESFLSDLCTIKRAAKSYDSTGAQSGVLETVAAGVACRVIEGNSNIEDIGDQQTLTEWYRLTVPVGTDLGANYFVELANGDVFKVIDLITQRSEATDAQAMMKREVR